MSGKNVIIHGKTAYKHFSVVHANRVAILDKIPICALEKDKRQALQQGQTGHTESDRLTGGLVQKSMI